MNNTTSTAPILLLVFIVFWLALAINPFDREVWVAENIILIICITYLFLRYQQHRRLSNTSYWLVFIFCLLQTIGAHYTYAEVPFGFWMADLFDIQRNHYDRLVHFFFGFLVILPFKETLSRSASFLSRKSEIFILVMLFIGISASYEILEFWYAIIYEKESAANMVLGSQGDIWDAEKDVFLAGLGAWLYLFLFTKNSTKIL